jgi:hypothetical protein
VIAASLVTYAQAIELFPISSLGHSVILTACAIYFVA